MSDLPDDLKRQSLSKLAIPGTHNSFTFSLNKSGPVGTDEEELVQKLAKSCITGPLTKAIIYRWARCQTSRVQEQLEQGVRYFDIRVGMVQDELYILHGLYGLEVGDVLREVASFLAKNPGEVVFLDFQHFYDLKLEHHDRLGATIESVFEAKLCPCRGQVPSLEEMTKSSQQVVVIYPVSNELEKHKFLWRRAFCPNPWANTMSTLYLGKFLDSVLQNRDRDRLLVSQAILTPQISTVIRHPFSSLKATVNPCTKFVKLTWLPKLKREIQCPNIVMTDFAENSTCRQIVAINYKQK